MKRRISRVLNFFAFNLLFFALYLNFIHKDENTFQPVQSVHQNNATETVLVENPETYTGQQSAQQGAKEGVHTTQKEKAEALSLSLN